MKQQVKIDVQMDEKGKVKSEISVEATVPLIGSVILTLVNNLKEQDEEAAKQLMKGIFVTYMTENLEELLKDEEEEDEKAVTNKIIAKI